MLQDHQLDKDVKKALAVTFYVNTADKAIDDAVDKTVDANEENKKIINVVEFSNEFSDHSFFTPLQQIIPVLIGDGEGEIDKTEGKSLKKLFKKTYKDDEIIKEIMDAKACGL